MDYIYANFTKFESFSLVPLLGKLKLLKKR